MALTKNPKRRPAAERMLHQPFVLAGDLNDALSKELLARVRNPDSYSPSGLGGASGVGPQGGASGAAAAAGGGVYSAGKHNLYF